MILVDTVADLRARVADLRNRGRRIALVPTMGNLHAGHIELMREARRHADAVVASIYVNPLQFGPQEDFAAYPRTPTQDHAILEAEGVELLFTPDDAQIYPRGPEAQTRVEVPGLSDILCGAFRPGHFRGVTTVVNRLLNLVQPDIAVFGKKDYQQLLLIRLMVQDLGMPVRIVAAETVREVDGLALSSRNNYLTADERRIAPKLYATLCRLRDQIIKNGISPEREKLAADNLVRAGFHPEYVSIRCRQDLGIPASSDRKLVILAAVWLGRTRLIDNLELEIPAAR